MTDKLAPAFVRLRTEQPSPTRPTVRTENDDPRAIWFSTLMFPPNLEETRMDSEEAAAIN
jgi:hypothetical protein